jgi:hypothetical protein
MVRWGLALGGYANEPALDAPVPFSALTYLLANVAQRAYGDEEGARRALARAGIDGPDVPAARAAAAFGQFAREVAGLDLPLAPTWSDLTALGLGFEDPGRPLRRGEVYALGRLLLDLRAPTPPPSAPSSAAPVTPAPRAAAAPR